MTHVTLDFETRSVVDLLKSGAYRYSIDPSTSVLCLAYRIDQGDLILWTPHFGDECPEDLAAAVEGGATIEAHGSWFEFCIWTNVCGPRMGWPKVANEQWRCTMVTGAYRGMPLGLKNIALAINPDTPKDPRGKRLITLLCQPRTPAQMKQAAKRGDTSIWENDPALFEELYAYCGQDVRAEEAVSYHVGVLPPLERQTWQLDQAINRRGVKIDVPFVEAAKRVVDAAIVAGERRLHMVTEGHVSTIGQTAKMQEWMRDKHDFRISAMDKETIEDALTDWPDVPEPVREVLQLRQSLARSSVKKLDALLAWRGDDDRLRGLFQYYGAPSTGRWASRGPQAQNFPVPTLGLDPEALVDLIMCEDLEFIQMMVGDPLDAVADALRSSFIAEDGYQYNSVDFSAIEAIVTAGIAGQESKLQVFRDGKDPYCVAAENVFGYPVNKKDHPKERQIGKICELAFGFQGGVPAWRNFDKTPRPDEEIEGYRDAWRAKHPLIVDLWRELNDAAKSAIRNPGRAFSYGPITYQVVFYNGKKWLACKLPSGRCLWYFNPGIQPKMMPWGDMRDCVCYWAWKEGQWKLTFTFGGKFTENVVQAAARDILVRAMHACERAGIPVVLHSHDEIVSEVKIGTPLDRMLEIFAEKAPWFENWPVKGEGWIGPRYRK